VAQKSEPFHYVAYNSSNTHTENRVVRTYLLDLSFSYVTLVATGVAGFLWLEGPGFRASERRKSHSGVQGQGPGGVWGQAPRSKI